MKSVKWGEYIYIGCDDGYILKISKDSGIVDSFPGSGMYNNLGLLDYNGEEHLIGAAPNNLTLLRTQDMNEISSIGNLGDIKGMDVVDSNHIYVISETLRVNQQIEGRFHILTIDNDTLKEVGRCAEGPNYTWNDIAAKGDYAYISARKGVDNKGYLTVIEATDPHNPVIKNRTHITNKETSCIDRIGDMLYVYSGFNESGIDHDVTLILMDSVIIDRGFAELVDQIKTNKEIYWMNQCFCGGFTDDLEGYNSIVLTASHPNELTFQCDFKGPFYGDTVENEFVPTLSDTFHHGEFNFHVMNAVRQKKVWPYDGSAPSVDSADASGNRGTSMLEAYNWDLEYNSIEAESPMISDLGNNASTTYLEWDDLLPPSVPEGFTYRYKRDTDTEWGIKLIWNDNDEVDISGYNIYRNGGFLDKTHKETTYINYDIDNYRGDTILYELTAFDLRDRESSESDLSFTIPISISNKSSATAYNNARRLLSYEKSIYSLYLSDNKVYCIISDDEGDTWDSPELVSDSNYTAKVPSGGVTNNGKIVAVWFRGNNKIMYSVRNNGVWSNPSQISYPSFNIHSLNTQSIAVKDDTCHIFMSGSWRTFQRRYQTKWYYGKFHIDNPSPLWRIITTQSGMKTTKTTITLKNKTPLLSYDKNNEIYYTQPVNGVWYKWNVSNSSNQFSKKPNIHYKSQYAHLTWVEESSPSSGIPVLECITIVPATDSTLDYDTIPFMDRPSNIDEPFVITHQWLYWQEEDTSGKYEIKRSCYDENTFSWDYPEDVSDIYWADACYPQALYFRPRKGDAIANYMVISSVWSEGEEEDIGIQERDEQIGDTRFASSNLGKVYSSPYEVQREGYLDYSRSSHPYEIVDYHPQELIYKIEELDPELRYIIKLGSFQRSDTKWKERIDVDGTTLGEMWVNSGDVAWFEKEIPADNTKDGEITIKVIKEIGDYAVCGALYLYEYTEENIKGAGGTKTTSTVTIDKFYVKPIYCGIMGLEIGLPENRNVELKIYDVTGRCVRTAIDVNMEAGTHRINIDGLSSGVYFYSLKAGNEHFSGKILNIK